jgi:TRAP-type C4-dicarboxylate transport system substrate-binding protein
MECECYREGDKMIKSYLSAALNLLFLSILFLTFTTKTEAQKLPFKVLAVASADPDHDPMIKQSKAFLEKIAAENNFEVDFTRDATLINDENLTNYQVLVQLHLAPFDMTRKEQQAMQHFISRGKGWVGIHAAGLTGSSLLLRKLLTGNGSRR